MQLPSEIHPGMDLIACLIFLTTLTLEYIRWPPNEACQNTRVGQKKEIVNCYANFPSRMRKTYLGDSYVGIGLPLLTAF